MRTVRVGAPAESRPAERRVACVPETVSSLVDAGLTVHVQEGAGRHAHALDAAYRAAGAVVTPEDPTPEADVVVSVQPLTIEQAGRLKPGAVTISFLQPNSERELLDVYEERRVTSFSFDLLPRVTRAQSADALSSQALVAGYRAVLVAAERLPRFLPMFTTAAGTVPPAKVLVLGRRSRRAAGDRDRTPAGRRRRGVRRAQGRGRGGRAVSARSSWSSTWRRSRVSTRPSQSEEFLERQRELIGEHVAASRRRGHHGGDPRQESAGARHDRHAQGDGAGLGRRRPGGGVRRQLRRVASRGRRRGSARCSCTAR